MNSYYTYNTYNTYNAYKKEEPTFRTPPNLLLTPLFHHPSEKQQHCSTRHQSRENTQRNVDREVITQIYARVADKHHHRNHQPRKPSAAHSRYGQHSHIGHRCGVARHGTEAAARLNHVHQPLQLGRMHRSQTRGERSPKVFQRTRVLEDSRNHIAQAHSNGCSDKEEDSASPAVVAIDYI